MQRNTTTLARSVRAISMIAILTLGSGVAVAGPHGKTYSCGVCDERSHHVHDEGGTLRIGNNVFYISDRGGALHRLERNLRKAGYRVQRYGNSFTISSRGRIGSARFRNGHFRGVITDKDWCSVTIRFHQYDHGRIGRHDRGWGTGHSWGRGHGRKGYDRGPRFSWESRGRRGGSGSRFEICW